MNDEQTHAVNGGEDDPWQRWVRNHYIQRETLRTSADEPTEAQIREAAQEMLDNGEGEADRGHADGVLRWIGLMVLTWAAFATACHVLHH